MIAAQATPAVTTLISATIETKSTMRLIRANPFREGGVISPALRCTTKSSMRGYKGWCNFRELSF
jgi:hypothetical protein